MTRLFVDTSAFFFGRTHSQRRLDGRYSVQELPRGQWYALIRDAQGMFARSSRGFSSEHQAFVAGWQVPDAVGGERWIVAECEQLVLAGADEIWNGLPGVQFRTLKDAGLLAYFTHPEVIADLVAEA